MQFTPTVTISLKEYQDLINSNKYLKNQTKNK